MATNILIFIDWFLPGTKAGGPVRSMANLTEHLSDTFKYWIVTRNTDYCETEPYHNVIANMWNEIQPNIHVYYASVENQTEACFDSIINDEKIDTVYINGIYSYTFSILPLRLAQKKKKKIIVAPRGMLNSQAFSSKKLKKKLFIQASRMLGLYKNVIFHATNEDEKKNIQNHLGGKNGILVAPNLHRKISPVDWAPKTKNIGEVNFVSIARISPEKGTHHALNFLLKLSRALKGQINFKLYGSVYNESYWQQCQNLIKQLPPNIVVEYMGSIPGEKITDAFIDAHFLFMPSEGENFGHSILESLSVGCPVIISDKTPWTNLEQKMVGWDIAIKNSEKFVDTLLTALEMDQEAYNKHSKAAYHYASEFCNNPELLKQSKNLFSTIH